MPIARQEVESPFLYDWEFEDELGITIDCGRFIVPDSDPHTISAKMAEFDLNDGRTGVARTERFRGEERTIHFTGVPFNIVKEFELRVGVRFRIRNCFGELMWCALRTCETEAIHGRAITRTEQLYLMTLTFVKISPI